MDTDRKGGFLTTGDHGEKQNDAQTERAYTRLRNMKLGLQPSVGIAVHELQCKSTPQARNVLEALTGLQPFTSKPIWQWPKQDVACWRQFHELPALPHSREVRYVPTLATSSRYATLPAVNGESGGGRERTFTRGIGIGDVPSRSSSRGDQDGVWCCGNALLDSQSERRPWEQLKSCRLDRLEMLNV